MLYKKIHRQYIREFRTGRKYKCMYSGKAYKVAEKPYIKLGCIWLEGWRLTQFSSGRLCNRDGFEWLED